MHTQASENVGYVYVAGYDATPDHVKIGMTERSPEERVEEWGTQTGSPGKPFIYYAAQVSNPRWVESMIHRRLRDRKIKGGGNEWFQGPDECIQVVREIAVDETVSILNRKKAAIIAQLERVEGSDEYRALQRRRAIEEEERQARLKAEERERQARVAREGSKRAITGIFSFLGRLVRAVTFLFLLGIVSFFAIPFLSSLL